VHDSGVWRCQPDRRRRPARRRLRGCAERGSARRGEASRRPAAARAPVRRARHAQAGDRAELLAGPGRARPARKVVRGV